MVQPHFTKICSMASREPNTTRCLTPTIRRRRYDLLGRCKARYWKSSTSPHTPRQTRHATFMAASFPGVNFPHRRILVDGCHQIPVLSLSQTGRTDFTALSLIVRTSEC